jgi:putative endonuclease
VEEATMRLLRLLPEGRMDSQRHEKKEGGRTHKDIKEVMRKQYYVYIMTNARDTTLYTGVTGDLKRRVLEHKEKLVEGFTKRYNLTKLVYYECCEDVQSAISREKQIKAGSRRKKIDLIYGINSGWRDLYNEL